jgi:ABC-2 type transport system ATP-binding protein
MIEAEGLVMHYGSFVALSDATFSVKQGEVVGLLGPNGAGKSTTMKILTTYLWPTDGSATVGGKSVTEDPIAVRRMTGYLPEVLPLYPMMEVGEYLNFVGGARGLSGAKLKERRDWVVERCGLKPMYRKLVNELSKGYRQRTALGQALIHDPAVVILDEPTSGLDPHQILEIRDLVRELAATKTVILSTHILQEAQAMADRIIIINRGRIVGQGTLPELREMAHETERVRFAVHTSQGEAKSALAALDAVKEALPEAEKDGVSRFVLVGPNAGKIIAAVGEMALAKGWCVAELTNVPYTLEETFLTLTEQPEQKKEGAA